MKPFFFAITFLCRAVATALNRLLRISLAALLGGAVAVLAQDYGNDKPSPVPEVAVPLTAEQKAQLQAVDVRIAGVETLIEKVDEPAYKANCVAAVKDMRKKRASLERNFDPASYETLMHSVISRYQVIALWLTPPRLPPPAKPVSTAAPADKTTPPAAQK